MFRSRTKSPPVVVSSSSSAPPGDDPFADREAELAELQRRLATLTQALSEKAEENLDLQRRLAVAAGKGCEDEWPSFCFFLVWVFRQLSFVAHAVVF
jgi:hypothetical protein